MTEGGDGTRWRRRWREEESRRERNKIKKVREGEKERNIIKKVREGEKERNIIKNE